jgi:hypothetical protein
LSARACAPDPQTRNNSILADPKAALLTTTAVSEPGRKRPGSDFDRAVVSHDLKRIDPGKPFEEDRKKAPGRVSQRGVKYARFHAWKGVM